MRHHDYRSLAVWFVAVSMIAVMSAAMKAGAEEWYAGIEVGSKGIKMIALPVDEDGKPDLIRKVEEERKPGPHRADEKQSKKDEAVNNTTLRDLKDGKFRAGAIEETREAVKDFYEQLTGVIKANRPRIKPENIWIVASSGLTMHKAANYDKLEEAIKDATRGSKQLLEITQRKEVELLMRGAIPSEHWPDTVLVDVGSGNVKCGYIHPKREPHIERPYVPDIDLEGTVAYRQTIEKRMKELNAGDSFRRFCKIAEERRKKLVEDVADEIGRYPGLINSERRRVYLSGGGPYVIASLLHPLAMAKDDVPEVRFTITELRDFVKKLQDTEKVPLPSLADLPPDERQLAEDKRRTVMDIFDAKSLLACAEILLGFNQALEWEKDKKELFFTKSGLVAWIVGYVVEQKASTVRAPGP